MKPFFYILLLTVLFSQRLQAQDPRVLQRPKDVSTNGNSPQTGNYGGTFNNNNNKQKDSLTKRDKQADSITISYRYITDTKRYNLDSTIDDFRRFATQPQYINLGNNGAASKLALYTPYMKAGFNQGKHAYDAYKWTLDKLKYYKTTRPYTELAYIIGSKAAQDIQFTHTQNLKPNWNIALDYRLINAPGYFRSQKNNHNNIAITSLYTSPKKRYTNWFAVLTNSLKANDNGGIVSDTQRVDVNRADRSLVETKLNNNVASARNPFDTKLESGHWNKEQTFMLKQSYDFGIRDSIALNDSVTNYLFYPKLRLEHTAVITNEYYLYKGLQADSAYYRTNYGKDSMYFKNSEGYELKDKWQKVSNDFSIYQYPDTKNTQQYIKAGITFEYWKGVLTKSVFRTITKSFINTFIHGEYRNKTRNKKYDIDASALLYLQGYNAGDYEVSAFLIRNTKSKLGNIKFQFQNVNSTPAFIYYRQSSFNRSAFGLTNLKKENYIKLTAQIANEPKQQNITAQLYVVNNATTWQSFNTYRQEAAFNMLQFTFEKAFKIYRKLVWRTEVQAQQIILGNANINYPTLYTRNRIAYEGKLGYKNLNLATGLAIRYISPYKLDAWSPQNGQFFYQNIESSKNNLPDISAYLNFNITSFNGFIQIENLNTATIKSGNNGGLKFINNNYVARYYTNPGLVFRLGIYWRFIN